MFILTPGHDDNSRFSERNIFCILAAANSVFNFIDRVWAGMAGVLDCVTSNETRQRKKKYARLNLEMFRCQCSHNNTLTHVMDFRLCNIAVQIFWIVFTSNNVVYSYHLENEMLKSSRTQLSALESHLQQCSCIWIWFRTNSIVVHYYAMRARLKQITYSDEIVQIKTTRTRTHENEYRQWETTTTNKSAWSNRKSLQIWIELGFLSEVGTCMALLLFLQYVYYIVSFDIRTVWIRLIIQEVKPTRMLHIAFHVVTVIQCVLRARRMNGTRIKFPDTNKKYLLQRLLRASCQIVHWKVSQVDLFQYTFVFIDAVGRAALPVQRINSFVINIIQ